MRNRTHIGLIAGFVSLILIFTAFIIFSSSFTSKTVLSGHARTIMENIASYTIDKSSNHLIPARNAAKLTLGLSQSNIVTSNNIDSMVAYFYEQLRIFPQFSGIYYGNTKGEFIMASRYNKLSRGGFFTKIIRVTNGVRSVELIYLSALGNEIKRIKGSNDPYDPRLRPWYKKAVSDRLLIWTSPYIFFTSKKPGITTANPVYSKAGLLKGVIGVDIEIDELSTFISKLKVGKTGRAFILSNSGDVIAYPDLRKIRHTAGGKKVRLTKISELDDPISRAAFESLGMAPEDFKLTKPVFTSFEINGEQYNAMFAPFKDRQWPWIICIYMPENDYLGSIKENRNFNIAVSLLAVIIAGLFGLVVARKLNRAREDAETADKAKGRFLALMSHEIRTPLNAVLGAGELLKETNLDDKQSKYLKIHQSAGEHLRELVSDVLDLSKVESGKFKLNSAPFDVVSLVADTCQVFELQAKKEELQLSCTTDCQDSKLLMGDAAALKQILVNLLGNAIKFTHEGSITMHAEIINRKSVISEPDAITMRFTVKDTGIGIPTEQQENIFDSFTQVDASTTRQYGGTGLGLAISKRLVEKMGGDISVENNEPSGSTFTFTAMFEEAPHELRTEKAEPKLRSNEPKKSLSILIVEDDDSISMLYTLFLEDTPHKLFTAASGEEALDRISQKSFDLVLMDIEMTGMDGYETTRRIRKNEKDNILRPMTIIAATAHAVAGQEELCIAAGCDGYLPKPITKSTLVETVTRIANKSAKDS